jgi:hypothetical protein
MTNQSDLTKDKPRLEELERLQKEVALISTVPLDQLLSDMRPQGLPSLVS